jgi:excisionase family DNA binding protein
MNSPGGVTTRSSCPPIPEEGAKFVNTMNNDGAGARPVLALASPYLTATEAAAYLRTTVQGIYALVKRRRLHPMPGRPGRLLFTRDALDRYLSIRRR